MGPIEVDAIGITAAESYGNQASVVTTEDCYVGNVVLVVAGGDGDLAALSNVRDPTTNNWEIIERTVNAGSNVYMAYSRLTAPMPKFTAISLTWDGQSAVSSPRIVQAIRLSGMGEIYLNSIGDWQTGSKADWYTHQLSYTSQAGVIVGGLCTWGERAVVSQPIQGQIEVSELSAQAAPNGDRPWATLVTQTMELGVGGKYSIQGTLDMEVSYVNGAIAFSNTPSAPPDPGPGPENPHMEFSGNEITDAVRRADVEGDGREPEGSTGIWEGTTNLNLNGGFESGLDNWIEYGGSTLTRDSSESKFGQWSCRMDADTNYGGIEAAPISITPHTSGGSDYSVSFWFLGTNSGTPHRLVVQDQDGTQVRTLVFPDDSQEWKRIDTLAHFDEGDTELRWHIQKSFPIPVMDTYWIDGAQVEEKPLPTPYVETTTTKASRGVSLVSANSDILDETQAWASFRLRVNYYETDAPNSLPNLMHWEAIFEGSKNRIWAGRNVSAGDWVLSREKGGFSATVETKDRTPIVAGQELTITLAWTADHVWISEKGFPFEGAPSTQIPDLKPARWFIGNSSTSGTRASDSDFFWVAAGIGTLTDEDAQALSNLPNNATEEEFDFPGGDLSFYWDGGGSPEPPPPPDPGVSTRKQQSIMAIVIGG